MNFLGYTSRPDGTSEHTCLFPRGGGKSDRVETLIRDRHGRLLRVERTRRQPPRPAGTRTAGRPFTRSLTDSLTH